MSLFVLFLFLLSPRFCFAQTTPTPVINPISGISLSEFMPNPPSGDEWVEIFNDNDFSVILDGWKIKDNTATTKDLNTSMPAKSFYVLDLNSDRYLNNKDGDTVNLINHLNQTVETVSYSKSDKDTSWSRQSDDSWCQVSSTQNDVNDSCHNQTTLPTSATNAPTSASDPTVTTPASTNSPAPEFVITDAPDDVEVGKTFSVSFEIKNATPGLDFHIKGFDIDNPTYTQTQNENNWLNYSGTNSAWDSHPSFSIESTGAIIASINLKYRSDKGISPDYPSRLRLKSDTLGESDNIQVTIVKVPPTSTSTPTPIPTTTPAKTPTDAPKSTSVPTTSITLVPSPTDTPTPVPTKEPIPKVLGAISPPQQPSNPKKPGQILPIIFMVTGGLFLTTPALITKFKKLKRK